MEYLNAKMYGKQVQPASKTSFEQYKKKYVNVSPTTYPTKLDDASILNVIIDIHQNLCEIIELINTCFQLQLLFIILNGFVAIVFSWYYILVSLANDDEYLMDFMLLFGYNLIGHTVNISAIIITCSVVINSNKNADSVIHLILNRTTNPAVKEKLTQFSLQRIHLQPQFSPFGIFTINGDLLYTIVGATSTYLIILVQFSTAPSLADIEGVICKSNHTGQ